MVPMSLTRKIVSLGVSSFVVISTACAADNDSNWYAGVGIGRAKIDKPYTRVGRLNTLEKTKTGYKAFGGYRFNSNFAVEVAFNDFRVHSGSGIDENGFINPNPDAWKFSTYSLSAVGMLPLGNDFSALGKIGLAPGRMSEFDSDGTRATSKRKSILLGVGVNYDINKMMFVRAEYEHFGKVGNPMGGPNVTGEFQPTMLSVSVGAKF